MSPPPRKPFPLRLNPALHAAVERAAAAEPAPARRPPVAAPSPGGGRDPFLSAAAPDRMVLDQPLGDHQLDPESAGRVDQMVQVPLDVVVVAAAQLHQCRRRARREPQLTAGGVAINELLSNSTLPLRDYIELLNTSATNVDISGWFLTDDAGVPKKFRIPNGTTILNINCWQNLHRQPP